MSVESFNATAMPSMGFLDKEMPPKQNSDDLLENNDEQRQNIQDQTLLMKNNHRNGFERSSPDSLGLSDSNDIIPKGLLNSSSMRLDQRQNPYIRYEQFETFPHSNKTCWSIRMDGNNQFFT